MGTASTTVNSQPLNHHRGCPGSCWGPTLQRQSQFVFDNLSQALSDNLAVHAGSHSPSTGSVAWRAVAVSRLSLSETAPREADRKHSTWHELGDVSVPPCRITGLSQELQGSCLASSHITLQAPQMSVQAVTCAPQPYMGRAAPLCCFSSCDCHEPERCLPKVSISIIINSC